MLGWAGLAAILALAAALRFANLDALGYANHYYTAAVESMLKSWHNFFFVAAEPGGSVSIDKPPLGLWLQAASAYFLGVNGFAVLLPEIVAGLLSVIVLYHLVRRSFGAAAGLLAALAMAITPIAVATDRNNTIDSPLILALLLAAWAFIKAAESGRLRYLLLGAFLVGIGFNIKMLQAYLPLPAFYAVYFVGSSESLRRRLINLALATAVLGAVSFSWAIVVEMTPSEQRPYVGSSSNNSVFDLIFGYNGLQRLTGMSRGSSRAGSGFPPNADGFPQPGGNRFPQPGIGQLPPARPGANGGTGGGRGFPGTGQPGALRLFIPPLSKEMSWLLPFGLFGAALLLLSARLRWPFSTQHQALTLWGGWLLTGGVFFSMAGFFHEYYLSMLVPALAALVAIGVVTLWRLRERRPWLAIALLLVATAGTLGLQFLTASAYVGIPWWIPFVVMLFVIGAIVLGATANEIRSRLAAAAGFGCVISAMLLTPGIWSGLTALNASANQSLPSAYSGQTSSPANSGRAQLNQTLLDYLQLNTQGVEYLMAVPSSMQGADYVIATGRPVLYAGGFMGQDKVVTAGDLERLVADGKLRFIYWDAQGGNGLGRGNGSQSDISRWVAASCTTVPGFEATTQNAGTPDGTGGAAGTSTAGPFGGRGGMRVTLYDCSGAADQAGPKSSGVDEVFIQGKEIQL